MNLDDYEVVQKLHKNIWPKQIINFIDGNRLYSNVTPYTYAGQSPKTYYYVGFKPEEVHFAAQKILNHIGLHNGELSKIVLNFHHVLYDQSKQTSNPVPMQDIIRYCDNHGTTCSCKCDEPLIKCRNHIHLCLRFYYKADRLSISPTPTMYDAYMPDCVESIDLAFQMCTKEV